MIQLSKIISFPNPAMYTSFYSDTKRIPLSVDLEFNTMGFVGELFDFSWVIVNFLDLGIQA